jgi:hypothetical protein
MMRLLGVVMLVLAACGHATRIRRTPIGGVFELGGNRHMAMDDARQQMAEHCPGGYVITQEGEEDVGMELTWNRRGLRTSTEWRVHYECVRATGQSSAPVPAPAPAVATAIGWWCVTYSGGIGFCFREKSECEKRRAADRQFDAAAGAVCDLRAFASCFGISFVGLATPGESCHPTPEVCNDQREFVLAHPEKASPLTMCRPID